MGRKPTLPGHPRPGHKPGGGLRRNAEPEHSRARQQTTSRQAQIAAAAIGLVISAGAPIALSSPAHADNSRLNRGVVSNVYTVQRQAGCTGTLTVRAPLQLAAQQHTLDVLNNRALDGDIGSDGSDPQQRAAAAGYTGRVAETVAINPALAISGLELIRKWYYDPASLAIMRDCAHTDIGVWSENSLDRTIVVAVYGTPVPVG